MSKITGMAMAMLSGAASFAWAQGAPMGTDASAAPGSQTAPGFTIDQKGVKRTGTLVSPSGNSLGPGAATSDPTMARKAGPLPGNGKDANPEYNARVVSGAFGSNAPVPNSSQPLKGQAAGTGKAMVGANANPVPDGSGNKSFFESRSNTNPRTTSPIVNNARTPGVATTSGAPVTDASGNKSFFESRSNTAVVETPAGAADRGKMTGRNPSVTQGLTVSREAAPAGSVPKGAAAPSAPAAQDAVPGAGSIFK